MVPRESVGRSTGVHELTQRLIAPFGDSARLVAGEEVFALGSPGFLAQSVTRGVVSNPSLVMPEQTVGRMMLRGEDVGMLVRWVLHDAQIFGGNSGGPLVNAKGAIVGINEIAVVGLSGAIPSNLVRMVTEQIISTGRVTRGWSGLTVQARQLKARCWVFRCNTSPMAGAPESWSCRRRTSSRWRSRPPWPKRRRRSERGLGARQPFTVASVPTAAAAAAAFELLMSESSRTLNLLRSRGFVRCSSMPAARHFSRVPLAIDAVSAMIGVRRPGASAARIRLVAA
ncbi:MAG: hypothetical protein EXS37_17835 [Opitutus sp.]|nr:hypothetical protein [Opitutus sp.]